MLQLLIALSLAAPIQPPASGLGLKPPPTKAEETQKYMLPKVAGMSAEARLAGYDRRLQIERDSPFSQILWRSVGPEICSARVIAAGSPALRPEQLFIAFATGGLWRTENDGVSWTPLFDHESSFSIGDFALSPDGKTVWVGTGENNGQRTRYSGTGVFKSVDAGKTWKNMGLPESHEIGRILVSPKDPNTVYVAAMGHLYSENPDRGVYKTTDGGKTWDLVLKVDDTTGAIDLVMLPKNPDVVFAAMWDRDRRAWNFREAGAGSAVYKSANAGKTWAKVAGGLPSGEEMGRTGLAICPSKPDTVYAFVDNWGADAQAEFYDERVPSGTLTLRRFLLLTPDELAQLDRAELSRFLTPLLPADVKLADVLQKVKDKKMALAELKDLLLKRTPTLFDMAYKQSRVYRSDDQGKTWVDSSGRMGQIGGYYEGRVTVNPSDVEDVWITGVPLLRSRDGGKTWREVPGNQHVDHHVVWIDPRNPKRVLDGNDGGPYLSLDGGEHWRHLNNLAVGQVTTLAVDNKIPYNVYVGMQDNGTMRGPSSYVAGRSDLSLWKVLAGGDGSAIAVDPRGDGDTVYVASQFGSHSAINQKTGERWNARAADATGEARLRYNWISPIFVSPHHGDIIYLGSQRLHRSLDQGRTYEPLSGDLTKNKPNGDVPFSTLTTLSESPFKFGMVYVGADDGTVKMTPNHGVTWIDIPTPQPDRWVTRIVASKWDKGTVYCCQNGYRQDDFSPYVWKSTDRGKTWKSIAGSLPNECVNTVREDPSKDNLLYVGTDLGAYVSFDGGVKWEVLGGGLPHTPVHDIVIQERDEEAIVGTHARGAWIISLKDVYDLTPETRAKDLYLWTVGDVTRSRRWGYERREPWNAEAPLPPTIKGKFWSKAPGKGFVRIKTKDGKVVKEMAIDVATGYNWFTMDLLLAPEKAGAAPKGTPKTVVDKLKDPLEANRAQFVPAGQYKLELTVGDKTTSQDWKVEEANDVFDTGRGRRRGEDSDLRGG